MPQITIKLSQNISMSDLPLSTTFHQIHEALADVANIDINTCHSGVIQESFSYVGEGNKQATKLFLEVYWLETPERLVIKNQLGLKLIAILMQTLVPCIVAQDLRCIPRVRIANLGKLDQEYFISK